MKTIPLTQGKFAVVDDEDYDKLSKFSWHYSPAQNGRTGYARRNDLLRGTKPLMHREILNVEKGVEVDHRNGDGLCNLRSNLRIMRSLSQPDESDAEPQFSLWTQGCSSAEEW